MSYSRFERIIIIVAFTIVVITVALASYLAIKG